MNLGVPYFRTKIINMEQFFLTLIIAIDKKVQEYMTDEGGVPTKTSTSKSNGQTHLEKKYRVSSLEKALSVLEVIIAVGHDLSITEISQRLSLSKGTTHRILNTLRSRSFVKQDSRTKMYGLGVRTLEIGTPTKKEKFLRAVMEPYLRDLHEMCNETVNAAVWEYNEIRYIYRLESTEMLRFSAPAGARFPGYVAATGKIFLSYFTNEEIGQIYGRKDAFKPLAKNSIGTLGKLIAEIEKVRLTRVAIDDEEAILGVYCVAAPVLNTDGRCVAAISISAPKNRMTQKTEIDFAKLVSKTALLISESMKEL